MVTIELRDNLKTFYCTFSGRIDTLTSLNDSEAIDKEIFGLMETEDSVQKGDFRVIFDMKEVTFISSSFIRICIAMAKKVSSAGFSLVNCDPFIKKTFKITGLDSSIPIS